MSNLYTGHWTCRAIANPATVARLDEEAQLRAHVQDAETTAPVTTRRAATETYHETYADHTARGAKPIDAMIVALQARLGVLERDSEAQAQRKRAWRAFTSVYPALSLYWWEMAVLGARLWEPVAFWRDLADELEAMAADADWRAAMRERADLLAGL
jgi:hypothetical protein